MEMIDDKRNGNNKKCLKLIVFFVSILYHVITTPNIL